MKYTYIADNENQLSNLHMIIKINSGKHENVIQELVRVISLQELLKVEKKAEKLDSHRNPEFIIGAKKVRYRMINGKIFIIFGCTAK